eukprot:COSAG05_NODE_4947_length_1317_cov_3.958949_1_plen_151_part_00
MPVCRTRTYRSISIHSYDDLAVARHTAIPFDLFQELFNRHTSVCQLHLGRLVRSCIAFLACSCDNIARVDGIHATIFAHGGVRWRRHRHWWYGQSQFFFAASPLNILSYTVLVERVVYSHTQQGPGVHSYTERTVSRLDSLRRLRAQRAL